MYYKGQGVAQDSPQALEWCRKAAQQGHAEARFLLDGMQSKRAPAPSRPQPGRPAEPDMFADLTPVPRLPTLVTINGIGFKLYGETDYDPETESYLTTHYFVMLFLPLFPIRRYRVVRHDGNRYEFLGRAPLRDLDKWHIGIFVALLLGMALFGR